MVLEPQGNNDNLDSKLTVRPATVEDTKAISSVLTQSFYNFPDLVNWVYPFLRFTINEDLRYRLRSHSRLYRCLVAKLVLPINGDLSVTEESNAELVVGTAEIALRSLSFWSTNLQYPYISNLAVHRDFRRLGIGSQLLSKCEQIALEWGYQETRLHVLDSNDSAKQLYCNNGYQISQIEANWVNLWFDYSPRLLLKKQL